MGQNKKQDSEKFMGDGFDSGGYETGDWGGSDGFSLWDSAVGHGFEDWEGRQETHDMVNDSYD
ncbi:hypothetical protein [Paenibacillus sp. NFR01]|uniref:hypothetical protein n=1 Tax=Paenibacillus sp. NFR01 TaxID=1566279 RepID=UPI0008CDA133|nr:hypothetical protein [Paenibacillus sp. NFR01]SEU27382.1 hypothetical protein SAMN03159358_4563 [Paenibacillus sp. NFR01]